MKTLFAHRRRALQAQTAARGLSGILSTSPADWYYLTGFTGEAGALIVLRKGAALVTDGRFTVQAKEEPSGIGGWRRKGPLQASGANCLRDPGSGKLGFIAGQSTVKQFRMICQTGGA